MKDGVYLITRRDGQALLLMIAEGRAVEVMQAETERRPKRRTTKRIGETITGMLIAAEERRRERILRALADL